MKEVLGILVLAIGALACGKDDDPATGNPVTADVAAADQPPAIMPPSGREPTSESEETSAPTGPISAEPEAQTPVIPAFDQAAYLTGQEAAMLMFVENLKAIRVYDAPPDFLKPTLEQSKVGVHYGAPFTSVEPLYRVHIYESPSNHQGCSGLPVGTLHHQLTHLWEIGSLPGFRPLGLEYRLFVIIQNGLPAIVAVDAHWKTLDGKNHYYDLGVTCEDGTPVLPTISPANF